MKEVDCPEAEANTSYSEASSCELPIEDLLVLRGSLGGKKVRVLKDDGCNTNVVSHEFFKKNRKFFKWKKCDAEVNHSKLGSVENASEVILGATLSFGKHKYRSNWLVSTCRYDVILGMPWHVASNLQIDYKKRIVKVDKERITSRTNSTMDNVHVTNMSVKKFRRML